jgi:hypothetical protein
MKILRRCLLLLTSLVIFSCSKSGYDKVLPAAAQNGSNTMGAYIDNVVWNPAHTGYGTGIAADIEGQFFSFRGVRYNAKPSEGTTTIGLELYNFTGTGTYKLPNAVPIGGGILTAANNLAGVSIGSESQTNYATDSLKAGIVTVTYYDPVKKIVSGTFSFDAVNSENPADVIHITGGRFDFTYPAKTIESVVW